MHPKGARKCRHCGEFFLPDARNQRRQRFCTKEPCRKASRAASSRRWRSKPENTDYFRGQWNAARVRDWQAKHPGYWKRGEVAAALLQDLLPPQGGADQRVMPQDGGEPLQHLFATQDPVLLGLISHLAGTVLQDSLLEIVRRLAQRGTILRHSGGASFRAQSELHAHPQNSSSARDEFLSARKR